MANASASTPKTDGLTAVAMIVNFQEDFARMENAPAKVALASGLTAARRIVVQEEIAGVASACARMATWASGLTAVRRTVGQVESVWRASVSARSRARRATRIGQTVARRIARLKEAGNVGMEDVGARKEEASGRIAARKTVA